MLQGVVGRGRPTLQSCDPGAQGVDGHDGEAVRLRPTTAACGVYETPRLCPEFGTVFYLV